MIKISQVITTEADLEKLLKKAGLTITELAKEANLSRQAIYQVLNGKCILTEKNWLIIKEIIGRKLKK